MYAVYTFKNNPFLIENSLKSWNKAQETQMIQLLTTSLSLNSDLQLLADSLQFIYWDMICGMECAFSQFRSAVLDVPFPPSCAAAL